MSDPSPVPASAQELAKLIRQHTFEEFDVSLEESASLIAEALTAAEARGRQQAEQADEEHIARLEHGCSANADTAMKNFYRAEAAEARVAALTQALKDYGHHKPACAINGGYGYECNCGLDAALTGAQAK